jgi:hypothetical protein
MDRESIRGARAASVVPLLLTFAVVVTGCNFLQPTEPPALPAGTQECFGMAEVICINLVKNRDDERPNLGVTAFRVRCLETCTLDEGIAEITIVWSDGSDDLYRTEWTRAPETGPPDPPATISQLN